MPDEIQNEVISEEVVNDAGVETPVEETVPEGE